MGNTRKESGALHPNSGESMARVKVKSDASKRDKGANYEWSVLGDGVHNEDHAK